MLFTIVYCIFYSVLFYQGVVLLGKFFVVKSIRDHYDRHYHKLSVAHAVFLFGAVVVLFSTCVWGAQSIGAVVGLTYSMFAVGAYVLFFGMAVLQYIGPKFRKFHEDLERKRG